MNIPIHPLARIVVDEATGQRYQLIPIHEYDASPETLTVEAILTAVADSAGVTVAALKSHRKAAAIVFPRQVAYWCAWQYTGASYPMIGRTIGGRDHTTVMQGAKRIERLLSAPGTHEAVAANCIIQDVQRRLGL